MKRYFFYGLAFALLAVAVVIYSESKWKYPTLILDVVLALYWFNRWRLS